MAKLSTYIEAVREDRPLLKQILDDSGSKSIWEFTNIFLSRGENQRKIYRGEFIDLLVTTFPKTPKEVLDQLRRSLKVNPIVSTADHHCLINHPVYINSNILLSLFARKFSVKKKPILLPPILSFSALPLNNAAYPKGLLLATPTGEKRFTFFGAKQRHQIIYSTGALSFSKNQVSKWLGLNEERFTEKELSFIEKILLKFSKNPAVGKCQSYADQINLWNTWLWKHFFPEYEINFFQIDLLTKIFFCRKLIKEKSLPLYKFLFKFPQKRQDELFDGIYGAWTLKKLKNFESGGGTSFFWGIDNEKRMIPLKREKNRLTAKEQGFKPIPWDVGELASALKNNRIVPSIITNYLVIAGYFGLYCSGAFNQIGYFRPIMNQYIKALRELGEEEEADRVSLVQTDGVHAFLYFLFGKGGKRAVPLCSLNMLQSIDKVNLVEKILREVSLKKAFEITAPLIFPFIVDPQKRDAMDFSFDDTYQQLEKVVPQELIFQCW